MLVSVLLHKLYYQLCQLSCVSCTIFKIIC